MANLHRHACLTTSLDSSVDKFRHYLMEMAVGDLLTLAIRPTVLLPDIDAEIMLRRDVIVTIKAEPPYLVSWLPSDHGAFPRLAGELHLVDDLPLSSRLVLTGDMNVPRSHLGHRFNQAIAKELLSVLASAIDSFDRPSYDLHARSAS